MDRKPYPSDVIDEEWADAVRLIVPWRTFSSLFSQTKMLSIHHGRTTKFIALCYLQHMTRRGSLLGRWSLPLTLEHSQSVLACDVAFP